MHNTSYPQPQLIFVSKWMEANLVAIGVWVYIYIVPGTYLDYHAFWWTVDLKIGIEVFTFLELWDKGIQNGVLVNHEVPDDNGSVYKVLFQTLGNFEGICINSTFFPCFIFNLVFFFLPLKFRSHGCCLSLV